MECFNNISSKCYMPQGALVAVIGGWFLHLTTVFWLTSFALRFVHN